MSDWEACFSIEQPDLDGSIEEGERMEEHHEIVAAICIVYYYEDVSAVLWSSTPLTQTTRHEMMNATSNEFDRIDEMSEGSTENEPPTLMRAFDDGVIGLLMHQHPEIQSVSFVESGFR